MGTYSEVPTRTTEDANSAADINQLQANIGANYTKIEKSASYVILDDDGYYRIECDTTAAGADITITLPTKADNLGRIIEIAHTVGGTYKVIISPDGADANKITNDGLNAVWLPKVGDFIRLRESADSGFWEVLNERITSQLFLDTYAGYGSTDTRIMRFTNVNQNVGNMFSENHVSGYNGNADGLEITINRSGRYAITFLSQSSGAAASNHGLSLNSNQLTTDIDNITVGHRIAMAMKAVNYRSTVNSVMYFSKNDVIRPHTDSIVPATATYALFAITYLGN